jgi:CRP/FNR family transcriptional regulator, cyclic AMP receptor protein
VHEGRATNAFFITLSGQFRVSLREGQEVARLGAGEVIGEIGFVDSAPPSATVTAAGSAAVLALSKTLLQQHLASDAAFAARFYRALAIFLADRLRATTRRLGYGRGGRAGRGAAGDEAGALAKTALGQVMPYGGSLTRPGSPSPP